MPTPPLARCLAVGLLAVAPAAAAQVDTSQLPSLTPAVFESRGTVAVALPEVAPQPLGGFGPLPRRYVVPADREPVVLPFAPDPDALPALALAPPAPPERVDLRVHTVRAEGGGGVALGRYGRADLAGAGAAGTFFLDADYDGVQGDVVAGGTGLDESVAFDRLAVRAGGQSYAPGRVRLEGHGLVDRYPVDGSARSRERLGFGAEAGLEGLGAAPFAVAVGFEQGRVETPGTLAATTEGRLDATGRIALLRETVHADAAAGVAGAGSFGTETQYGSAGLAVQVGREGALRVRAGARGLAYQAPGASADAQYVAPILDASLPVGEAARAFVRTDPRVGVRSLLGLTDTNPYVVADPTVTPDVVLVDARGGVELAPGPFRARVFATALKAPTWLAFERSGPSAYLPVYLDVEAVGVGGDVALVTASGVSATAGVEVRRARPDVGERVPFFAPVVGRAGLQVPFALGRGRVGLAAYGEGPRPSAGVGGADAPAWGRLDLDASYVVSGPFSVVARATGYVGEAGPWPGAPVPPYTVLAGLRLAR